jgi:hypothetical protein
MAATSNSKAPQSDRRDSSRSRSRPGFVAGYYMHERATGRLMNVTFWRSEEGSRRLNTPSVSDRRAINGIRPSKAER